MDGQLFENEHDGTVFSKGKTFLFAIRNKISRNRKTRLEDNDIDDHALIRALIALFYEESSQEHFSLLAKIAQSES